MNERGRDDERRADEIPVTSGPAGLSWSWRSWRVWVLVLGVFVLPTLLYAAIPTVLPFLPLTTGQKVWASGGLVVVAEGIFLLSALVLGREAVRSYRRYLDPRTWLRKR